MKQVFLSIAVAAGAIFAQNAAVSSYLYPNDGFNGDIRIKEVRVPTAGYAPSTYWCALGWATTGVSGYGGMQYVQGSGNNYIYSVWNDDTKCAWNDPKMQVTTFGGEGTGVKSLTFGYPWSCDYWNVLADRCWDEGSHTFTAFFIKDGKTGIWRHLITWDIPLPKVRYGSSAYNFIEDWASNGLYRQGHYRKGWKRNASTNVWFPIGQCNYSYNSFDVANASSRSWNKRNNWEGGKTSDATGEYYFMGAGGSIPNTANNGTAHKIARTEKAPQEEYGKLAVAQMTASPAAGKVIVQWKNDSTTVPQFSYSITIKEGTTIVATKGDTLPQKRSDTLTVAGLSPSTKSYTVELAITDMFDGKADVKKSTFGVSTAISEQKMVSSSGNSLSLNDGFLSINRAQSTPSELRIVSLSGRTLFSQTISTSTASLSLKEVGICSGSYLVILDGITKKIHFK